MRQERQKLKVMAAPVITPTPLPEEKRYQCRIEELPTLSGFILQSLENDLADFSAHSPVFDADYITAYRAKRDEVMGLIKPRVITDRKKTITEDLNGMLASMRQPLNKLENYVTLASTRSTLSVLPQDFGISRVREAISNGDVEELDGAMIILKTHISDNYSALTAVGYTNAQRDELYAMWNKINTDNSGQNEKDDERDDLAGTNTKTYNQLWDIMTEVCSTGKSLYLIPRPAKADEYTISALINRIRQEKPKPRFRVLLLKPNETRVVQNIIPGSEASNKGNTVIALWDKAVPQPPDAPELDLGNSMLIPSTWSTTISVRNLSSTEKGKLRILGVGSLI